MTTEYEAIAQRLDWMDSQLSKDAATALREADRQQTRIQQALVSGAEDMRKARNQILDMLVEIGNLREDRDKLIEAGEALYQRVMREDDRIVALEAERDQLLAWKQSALEVEKDWDCQRIGKLLHIPLGESVRAGIEPAIVALYQHVMRTDDRIVELEAERYREGRLLQTGWTFRWTPEAGFEWCGDLESGMDTPRSLDRAEATRLAEEKRK